MNRQLRLFAAIAATVLVACNDGPTELSDGGPMARELVITEGIGTPARGAWPRPSSTATAEALLVGSVASPLSLKPQSCGTAQQISLTYRITGNQASAASFKVNTVWVYDGTGWVGSSPVTVSVAARSGGGFLLLPAITISVSNGSGADAGSSPFNVAPFDLVTNASDPEGQQLRLGATSTVTVHVNFVACPIVNTPPVLVVPADIVEEATSSAGAVVEFEVTANDAQDGDLSASVICDATSGDTFPLGTTTVNCSVTDSHGVETTGSFTVTVQDTTPAYFTSFPTGTVTLIAADIDGAVLVIGDLGITVEDAGNVSEPAEFACDYVAGTVLAIGTTTPVACRATDAIGNTSNASVFDVFVGLNVTAQDFLPPLRVTTPFSSHKRGSTIPHKFLPPTYADGTPAIDLADGLRLTLTRLGGDLPGTEVDGTQYAAGSTEWRYDTDPGHYIFNLKTLSAWSDGAWQTSVSYAGIVLAETEFVLKR